MNESEIKKIEAIKKDFKQSMEDLYGDRLVKVLLYGSYARGDFHEESDVDFMVVLKDENIATLKEVRNISHSIYDLILRYKTLISAVPTTLNRFLNNKMPFYLNVHQDAVTI